MRLFRTIILCFSFVLIFSSAWSQLVTYSTPVNLLIENFFCGDYVVSNYAYTGSLEAIGSFEASGTDLGIEEGIIMTTGIISTSNDDGPQGPNDLNGAGYDNGTSGSALLSTLNGGISTYNASRLEFDLFMTVDSLEFEIVFGSEEYLEYVGSQFTDLFGVFITGPGIPGMQNIAKLPSNEVISINTIHSFAANSFGTFGPVNEQYYVNNDGGAFLQYDGFTVPIKVKANLEVGATYHIIIVIADAGDPIIDSGIFLQKCSDNFQAGLNENDLSGASCFPNPSVNGQITLQNADECRYEIVNEAGQVLREGDFTGETVVSGLDAGLYIVRFITKAGSQSKRVVVG